MFRTYKDDITLSRKGATPRKKAGSRQARSKSGNKLYLIWLLSGALAGVLISSSIFMHFSASSKDAKKQTAKVEKSLVPEEKKPKFDFYAMLSKASNSTNTQPAKKSTLDLPSKAKKEEPPIAASSYKYIIQAGSFKKFSDADELRAQLTLEGFDTDIEKISLSNGKLWHRVIIGPFNTEQQAQSKQESLEKYSIRESLVLKRND